MFFFFTLLTGDHPGFKTRFTIYSRMTRVECKYYNYIHKKGIIYWIYRFWSRNTVNFTKRIWQLLFWNNYIYMFVGDTEGYLYLGDFFDSFRGMKMRRLVMSFLSVNFPRSWCGIPKWKRWLFQWRLVGDDSQIWILLDHLPRIRNSSWLLRRWDWSFLIPMPEILYIFTQRFGYQNSKNFGWISFQVRAHHRGEITQLQRIRMLKSQKPL
jgi:hypothetical protein